MIEDLNNELKDVESLEVNPDEGEPPKGKLQQQLSKIIPMKH